MWKRTFFVSVMTMVFLKSTIQGLKGSLNDIYTRQKKSQWFEDGVKLLKENIQKKEINRKAKGVILFVGDGMGISTVTAARVLDGQLKGNTGEENVLSWEKSQDFPNVALSKTYNTDAQTGDSAACATAMMTGVKVREGIVSKSEKVVYGNCTSGLNEDLISLIMMAEDAGLSTGIVTTARVTHATPATAYAHSAHRSWEAYAKDGCIDIASQLVNFSYGDGIEVVLGGGRRSFLPSTMKDPELRNKRGYRKDGRNLVEDWVKKSTNQRQNTYVWNETSFKNLDPNSNERVLGLFNFDHMEYDYERVNDTAGEPSLSDMIEFAIKKLQKNDKGYVLFAEGGRMDHAHHNSKAFLALHETLALDKAVETAVTMTNPEETLLIVTADHSHVFTFGGYQTRGNPIFGFTNKNQYVASDGLRYTSLGYFNGPGAPNKVPRSEPVLSKLVENPYHAWQSVVPINSESHGAEDVGIYARGAQAHLIRGVVEQNYIFHVMDYALCLSESKKDICQSQGLETTNNSSIVYFQLKTFIFCLVMYFLYV